MRQVRFHYAIKTLTQKSKTHWRLPDATQYSIKSGGQNFTFKMKLFISQVKLVIYHMKYITHTSYGCGEACLQPPR